MNRATVLLTLALSTPALAGAPALVTLATGDVKIGDAAAPNAPFVLEEGQAIRLAEGASVVVLHEGTATRVRGPRTVGIGDLTEPSTGGGAARGALDAVLARNVSFTKAGASRGDELRLVRPVPGGAILALGTVAWHCAECGEQPVEVYDFLAGETVWTGKGTDNVAYGGRALGPGAYLVKVGAAEFSFTVATAEEQERVRLAREAADAAVVGLKGEGVSDPAALVSIPASVYLRAGLVSEALWMIDGAASAQPDDASLSELRAVYERRAGLADAP